MEKFVQAGDTLKGGSDPSPNCGVYPRVSLVIALVRQFVSLSSNISETVH